MRQKNCTYQQHGQKIGGVRGYGLANAAPFFFLTTPAGPAGANVLFNDSLMAELDY
jgi:hypothetical protein